MVGGGGQAEGRGKALWAVELGTSYQAATSSCLGVGRSAAPCIIGVWPFAMLQKAEMSDKLG